MYASNMKTVTLSAAEVAVLRDMGWFVACNQSEYSPLEMDVGETVAILEPWAQLKVPTGAYNTDLPNRYIYEADKTAEPYRFRYQPAETMPMEAVKRYAVVETVGPGWFWLRLIGEESAGKYHII